MRTKRRQTKSHLSNRQFALRLTVLLGVLLCVVQLVLTAVFDQGKRYVQEKATVIEQLIHVISPDNTSLQIVELQEETEFNGHGGFARARRVKELCSGLAVKAPAVPMNDFKGNLEKRILYCPVEKVGTTFWHRLFYMLAVKQEGGRYQQPYDAPIDKSLANGRLYSFSLGRLKTKTTNFLSDNTFKFYFARNPYNRLVSAFVDKLLPPNPYYWKAFGVPAIRLARPGVPAPRYGHDVTFPEFVKYVIDCEKKGRNLDVHFKTALESCRPCEMNYHYIGLMENFTQDSLFILKRLGLNEGVKTLQKNYKNLTTDDAIVDSVISPFSWKKDVVRIISWETALKRIWLKLQLRGIISLSIPLPLDSSQVAGVTNTEFIELVRKANRESDPAELKTQKRNVLKEAFSLISSEDIEALQSVFRYDFELYGYTLKPDFILKPGEEYTPLGYFRY